MAQVVALQEQRESNLARQQYEEDQQSRRQADPRENSARKKESSCNDRRRHKGSRRSKKGRAKKKHYWHSSSSSSLLSSSDSEDTESRSDNSDSSLKPKTKWYVVVCPDGRRYLDSSKELSLGFQCPGCMKGSFKDHHRAWKFHDHWVKAFQEAATKTASKHTPGPSPPIPPEIPLPPATPLTGHAPVGNKVRNPGYLPVILRSGKDKSTEGEVYGINLEVSERELTKKLAPPGVPAQMA
jgi:hypothetical protein